MNASSWVAYPPQKHTAETNVDNAQTAKEMINALYEAAKERQDPELLSKIGELQGLYTGYELTSHPELAEEIMVKLGRIIGSLLAGNDFDPFSALHEKSQTDLICFIQEQRDYYFVQADGIINNTTTFVDIFDRYLSLQGKKEQTRKIYRGKAKLLLKEYTGEQAIRISDLEYRLLEILDCRGQDAKKDHNLISTIRNLLEFIAQLQRG